MSVFSFRHGKMYVYSLPEKDHSSLAAFADGWYRNVKAEAVPTEATPL